MSTWRTFRSVLILLAASLIPPAPPATAGETAPDPPPPAGHHEHPDDPQVKVERRQQERTTQSIVLRGNHRSVQVNVDAAGNNIVGDAANEPSIAVDPTNPDNLVIGWRQFDTIASNFRQAGWAYSDDAGATWTFPGVIQPGQFRSDPVLSADAAGVFYYYSLSGPTSAEMFRSTDKGLTWIGPVNGFGGDKEWMTVDVSGSAGDGNVHAIWNSQFTCCAPGTDSTRSIDGGVSFEGPFALPIKTKWGTLDVGPDGELFVVGSDLNTLATPAHYVLRSTNAFDTGATPVFDLALGVDLGGTTLAGATPNPGGLLGQVWIAVDRSAGPTRGDVYVLGSVDPPGSDPLDVHLIRSSDGGQTWTAPVRVNDDPAGSDAFQWFGTMSVAPDGRIDVIWNDTRNDPGGQNSEVFYSYSTDAGATWSGNLPVTPPWNSLLGQPNQAKIGDYYQMFSDARGAGLAFSATFNGEQDVYFLRVGDCNDNGQHDSIDLATNFSDDCNGNRIPDECDETLVEICDDGIDNDCDDAVDCDDPDCPGGQQEECADGIDNDCDAAVDCGDPDCVGTAACPCDLDGVCDPGEDCTFCPEDCPGGTFCCGDGACDPGENPCLCPVDCGAVQFTELKCADGVDNDCDDLIDCQDVADCSSDPPPSPPAGFPVLEIRPNGGVPLLVWTLVAESVGYDVVEGDVALLHASGGDFAAATTGCLVSNVGSPFALSPGDPPLGTITWFLVRPRNCGGPGSYDSGAATQAASRDAAVEASGNACP